MRHTPTTSRSVEVVAHWGNLVGDFLFYLAPPNNTPDAWGFDARVFGWDKEIRNVITPLGYMGGSSGVGLIGRRGEQAAAFVMAYMAEVAQVAKTWGTFGEDVIESEIDRHALSDPLRFHAYARYVIPGTHQCIECGAVFTDVEMDEQQYEGPQTYPYVWLDADKQGDPVEKMIWVMTGTCDDCEGIVHRAALDAKSPPVIVGP